MKYAKKRDSTAREIDDEIPNKNRQRGESAGALGREKQAEKGTAEFFRPVMAKHENDRRSACDDHIHKVFL